MRRWPLFIVAVLAFWLEAVAPSRAGIEVAIATAIASLLPAIGPISLAAGAGFGIAAGTFAIAQGITAALLLGGSIALNSLFANKPSVSPAGAGPAADPAGARNTFSSSEGPELRAVGRVRIGGLKIFGNSVGAHRDRLIAHCKGPIDAIETVYLGGREVVADLGTTGIVSSYPWAISDNASYIQINYKLGTGTETAWPTLTSSYPGVWTSDHRVRGIAQSWLRYDNPGFGTELFLKLYPDGPPEYDAIIRAELVYDPRTTLTAWGVNGILNAVHILLADPALSIDDIDLDFMASEADRADALVDTLDGSMPRATCDGVWSSETARKENMQRVLDSIGAWIVPRAGGLKIGIQLIDDDPDPEITIATDYIVSYEWQSGPAGVERPNICRVKYYSPERNYEMAEIDLTGIAWARIDDEVDAYGPKYLDVELPFCTSAAQAQRIARRKFAMARSDSGTIKTNMAGLAAWGARVIAFEMPDGLGTLKAQIGPPRIDDQNGIIEFPFVTWPELEPWDTATDEAAAPEPIPEIAYGTPITQPNAPTECCVVTYPDGTGTFVRIGYATPGDDTVREACFRKITNGKPEPWQGMAEYSSPAGRKHAFTPTALAGLTVQFRLRTFNGNNGSTWSSIYQVVPAANNTGPGRCGLAVTTSYTLTDNIVVTAPLELQVAYLSLSGPDAPSAQYIYPGEQKTWAVGSAPDAVRAFSATGRASTGNPSGTVTASLNMDQTTASAVLSGNYNAALSKISMAWTATSDPSIGPQISTIRFTGPSAPANTPTSAGSSGSWDVTGITAGSYAFTAQCYDAGGTPLGTAAAFTFTVG